MEATTQTAAPQGAAPDNKTERARIAAILNLEEAKGRENLARTLALETDHDPETARKLLAASPVAQPAVAVNPLAAAMEQVPNPKVGMGAEQQTDDAQTEANAILAFVPKRFRRAS